MFFFWGGLLFWNTLYEAESSLDGLVQYAEGVLDAIQ